MTTTENVVWGIHGGRRGEADDLFLKGGRIALGWAEAGDLRAWPPDRDSFKARVVAALPDARPGAIPVFAGVLFRFLYEMEPGHIVAYPSKSDRLIHIGRIQGEYHFDPKRSATHPHQRTVKWEQHVPRTQFSQGALFEIGSAVTLFQIRNYADEYFAALRGTVAVPAPSEDQSIGLVVSEIEESTRDFVLKRLATDLKGHPLAAFVAHILGKLGYRTRLSPEGPDGGIDIIAHKDELGLEPPIIKVQVKSGEGSVGEPVVSALYGKVSDGEYGLLVTLGSFTSAAKTFARNQSSLRLIDANDLVKLILDNYESLDSRYKGLLPLRRVYVPETLPLEES
jgi:restriction system protein